MSAKVFSFLKEPPKVAYIDPSFFINYLIKDAKFHHECLDYSLKLQHKRTVLLLSNLGLDEIWFVLLKNLSIKQLLETHEEEKRWLTSLKEHPELVKRFSEEIKESTLTILEIPNLVLVEITGAQTLKALEIMQEHGVLPRDAIHAAATIISESEGIITTDQDFARIKDITVYTCNPRIL